MYINNCLLYRRNQFVLIQCIIQVANSNTIFQYNILHNTGNNNMLTCNIFCTYHTGFIPHKKTNNAFQLAVQLQYCLHVTLHMCVLTQWCNSRVIGNSCFNKPMQACSSVAITLQCTSYTCVYSYVRSTLTCSITTLQ